MTSSARARATVARVEADLAKARLRREDLGYAFVAGRRRREEIEVEIADVDARIAELEAEREELVGGPVPSPEPANDLHAAASPPEPAFLDTRAAAALLGMTPKALESLRARGRGPAFVQIGRSIRYRREDLLQGVPHGSRRGSD